MFIDRSERNLSTRVVGQDMPAPIIFGPIGEQTRAHEDGETATAKVAAGLNLTYVHSSRASKSVEEVAAAAPQGSRWFGFDWPDDGDPDLTLLIRAQAAGCTHLVLYPPQPGQGWGALEAIQQTWDGPIVLTGIQSPAAARMAIRRGLDGIVVSNERGRRGSRPRGTIQRLPEIVDEVDGKVDVLFGSGVINGADAFKAIAFGAKAILISRPYVHGLALAGEDGVRHMMRTLLAEFEINLAIAGVQTHHKLNRQALECGEPTVAVDDGNRGRGNRGRGGGRGGGRRGQPNFTG